jgi:hypothetical protein
MAGLVPAIHAAPLQGTFVVSAGGSAWMPGTRPGMTRGGCKERSNYNNFVSPDSPARSGEGLGVVRRANLNRLHIAPHRLSVAARLLVFLRAASRSRRPTPGPSRFTGRGGEG